MLFGLPEMRNSASLMSAAAVAIGARRQRATGPSGLSVDHGRSKALELYVGTQMAGGLVGVVLANVMFDLAPVAISTDDRATVATTLSEGVATSGLLVDRLTCRATASTFASPARPGLSRCSGVRRRPDPPVARSVAACPDRPAT
jgi:hypothetical protein